MIELGSKVKDVITGFTGIAVAKIEWLHGCDRIGVEPQELKDGKPIDAHWFDEARLEVIDTNQKTVAQKVEKPGGPQNAPTISHAF